jgi:hypothetical protein
MRQFVFLMMLLIPTGIYATSVEVLNAECRVGCRYLGYRSGEASKKKSCRCFDLLDRNAITKQNTWVLHAPEAPGAFNSPPTEELSPSDYSDMLDRLERSVVLPSSRGHQIYPEDY